MQIRIFMNIFQPCSIRRIFISQSYRCFNQQKDLLRPITISSRFFVFSLKLRHF